jgi:hypothetical protein
MQKKVEKIEPRQIDSKLQHLCDFLALRYGGFVGLALESFRTADAGDSDVLSAKAIAANKGRTLYPQLQYLCNYLNSGKRLF